MILPTIARYFWIIHLELSKVNLYLTDTIIIYKNLSIGEINDMKRYQEPVMETVFFPKEAILTSSGNEPDVLFDASMLDDGFGGNG